MGKRLVEGCLALDLAWLLRLASIRAGQAERFEALDLDCAEKIAGLIGKT